MPAPPGRHVSLLNDIAGQIAHLWRFNGDLSLSIAVLDGMRVLIIEDEFLIAMDVEQLCRDHGAADVVILRKLAEHGPDPLDGEPFHVAILDVMLSGSSTTYFARRLSEQRIPYIFATGYSDSDAALAGAFPDVEIVSKPYAGDALMGAIARALERRSAASGGV